MIHIEHVEIPQLTPSRPAEIRVIERHWDQLRAHLLADRDEHAALLICGLHATRSSVTFLVRGVVPLTDDDYLDAGQLHLSIAPGSLARYVKQARSAGATLILCHSHPFPGEVLASPIDLQTETELCGRVFPGRLSGLPSGALVVGPDGIDGRVWDRGAASPLTQVTVVGGKIARYVSNSCGITGSRPVFRPRQDVVDNEPTARQALLWGEAGQRVIRAARVAVVGCGGTGSHVVAQLAHLRLGGMTLIDNDKVEATNLSRLVGATPADVGRFKVEVLAEHARAINPSIEMTTISDSVLDVPPSSLLDADVIVCATDGHGSRALLTEIAQQYLVPVVDLGVEVDPSPETFRAGGGVRVLRPGRGCLHCANTLVPELVREEYLDDAQRRDEVKRGYIRDEPVPAPSVIALNGVVASLAVLEVCELLVGMLGSGRNRLLYRAESRALTTATMPIDANCYVCGESGLLGLGDTRPLPTRWRATADAG